MEDHARMLSHLREPEGEKPSDLEIRASSRADLIKYWNVNAALVSGLFNYLESNTLPHVHFPDDNIENQDLLNNHYDN